MDSAGIGSAIEKDRIFFTVLCIRAATLVEGALDRHYTEVIFNLSTSKGWKSEWKYHWNGMEKLVF